MKASAGNMERNKFSKFQSTWFAFTLFHRRFLIFSWLCFSNKFLLQEIFPITCLVVFCLLNFPRPDSLSFPLLERLGFRPCIHNFISFPNFCGQLSVLLKVSIWLSLSVLTCTIVPLERSQNFYWMLQMLSEKRTEWLTGILWQQVAEFTYKSTLRLRQLYPHRSSLLFHSAARWFKLQIRSAWKLTPGRLCFFRSWTKGLVQDLLKKYWFAKMSKLVQPLNGVSQAAQKWPETMVTSDKLRDSSILSKVVEYFFQWNFLIFPQLSATRRNPLFVFFSNTHEKVMFSGAVTIAGKSQQINWNFERKFGTTDVKNSSSWKI